MTSVLNTAEVVGWNRVGRELLPVVYVCQTIFPDHLSRAQYPLTVFQAGVLFHHVGSVVEVPGDEVDETGTEDVEIGESISLSVFFSLCTTLIVTGCQTGSGVVVGLNSTSGCRNGG